LSVSLSARLTLLTTSAATAVRGGSDATSSMMTLAADDAPSPLTPPTRETLTAKTTRPARPETSSATTGDDGMITSSRSQLHA